MSEHKKDIKDWFQRLYHPLKNIHSQYYKLNLDKNEITKIQKLLNEYDIKNYRNRIRLVKDDIPFEEKTVLNRFNIYNYAKLERDNLMLKNLLSKVEEQENKKINLKLKKFKTNNEYGHLTLIKRNKLDLQNINSPLNSDRSNKSKLPLNFISNHDSNKEILKTDSNYLSSLKHDFNSKSIDGKNIIKINKTDNNLNYFNTLDGVEQEEVKRRKKRSKNLENIYDQMKIVIRTGHNCEKSGKILNEDILLTKRRKIFDTSIHKNKSKDKFNKSINYSKIRTKKDIERNIINNQTNDIFKYLKENIKLKSQRRITALKTIDNENNYVVKNINLPMIKNN